MAAYGEDSSLSAFTFIPPVFEKKKRLYNKLQSSFSIHTMQTIKYFQSFLDSTTGMKVADSLKHPGEILIWQVNKVWVLKILLLVLKLCLDGCTIH